jgi:four helix bundle protein
MIDLKHKKLDVWKIAIELTSEIYKLTSKFPANGKYGLVSQLRRAAVSISSNSAEGAARSSPKERRRFHEIARSFLVEIDTQLEISSNLKFTTDNQIPNLDDKKNHLFAILSNLIRKTK